MEKKVTSAIEVAKLANVSQSTVSRVFTPGASVSEKTRQKVLKVAEELNYQPNALARGLITKKTNMVGLAMKDIQNPFYHEVLGVFTKKLRAKGYSVLFVYTENEEIQQEEINHFLEYNVEGIIVTDALLSSKVVAKLQNNNIPVTLFNRDDKNLMCNSVSCDNMNAAREIAKYIYEKGYKDIVYITGKINTSTNQDRQKGFTDFLTSKGIEVTIVEGDYTYEKSFHLTKNLIETGHRPEAIFGANDITALGALDALKEKKICVPDETIVIGFDDIKMSSWPNYGLSTWVQPIEQMVDETIKLLDSPNDNHQVIHLKGQFIHRRTTI
ncbi:LacI family DNA-binding transcriptional regulator [Metabacillus sediminilitoris]|uniref:LacI family transcriptional regulator n=1 Tax=Metabacillus sediminilitoris TaxID=2567941 RepID=A0A4S4BUH2_9BACI|nr:LacI family DNA-binding transcriptional regulator [Metabacillus sediminilitoris]QGQ44957.1 substrate-binding domain-containing protein [Metabacillus sediminilitoris]THF78590.1 LacI family transcriptional regulator [Metabacillus sediminilitoris]